jgi:hypothetical protein
MNSPRATALRLRITGEPNDERESDYTITASVPGQGQSWINRVPRYSLNESRLGYARALGEFKRLIGSDLEQTDWGLLEEALGVLRLVNGRLITALAAPRIVSFRKFVEEALDPLRHPLGAPVVEVHTPSELLFPFELVQARSGDWPPAIRDRETLLRACKTFLGFSSPIRRVFTNEKIRGKGLDQNRILRNRRGGLALTLFQDASLEGARNEAAFFHTHSKLFHSRVWPQPESTSIAAGLASQLFDSRAGLDGAERRSLPDEIQHFACHCSTSNPEPQQHALSLGADGAESCAVTIGELDARFGLIEASEDPPRPGPLVFLNACASAAIPTGFSTSFVQWFLRNENRGVIGTETLIPDKFAAAFAGHFYTAFLAKEPVGQALISAKCHMVREYCNPLGIVYTMYADPDLQVEKKT